MLTLDVKVIEKRTKILRSGDTMATHQMPSTAYFVTFEFENNNTIEFHVSSKQYGIFIKGDVGKLTFQGTRYKNFKPIKN